MSKNTRRTFLKTVGLAVGTAGVVGATTATKNRDEPHAVQNEVADTDSVETHATGWTFGPVGRMSSSPAVSDGLVYIGPDDGTLRAIDCSTGTLTWENDSAGTKDHLGLTYSDGSVYVGGEYDDDEFRLSSYMGETGELDNQKLVQNEPVQTPVVADGTAYYPTENQASPTILYAVDTETGETKWTFSGEDCGTGATKAIAEKDGHIFIAQDRTIWSLDAETGDVQWSYEDTNYSAISDLSAHNDILYVGLSRDETDPESPNILALDTEDGDTLWCEPIGYHENAQHVTATDDHLFASMYSDGSFYLTAIRTHDAHEEWEFRAEDGNFVPESTAKDGVVYAGHGSQVTAFDGATGTKRKTWQTTGDAYGAPVVTDNALYQNTRDGYVHKFDRDE
ncbi:PQQ-binding-like beta-propeller repeat protein [Haladaptatus cibarius]|uniref:PQQ-binding-like beta-propeller repeat protein n=1 Tax=Haladaptatus cibarius TaxID=453847 RepID=UPI000679A249|nr:PQQ-binding-like beta-propeller repeat protein [Haladaptatus cibarius]